MVITRPQDTAANTNVCCCLIIISFRSNNCQGVGEVIREEHNVLYRAGVSLWLIICFSCLYFYSFDLHGGEALVCIKRR